MTDTQSLVSRLREMAKYSSMVGMSGVEVRSLLTEAADALERERSVLALHVSALRWAYDYIAEVKPPPENPDEEDWLEFVAIYDLLKDAYLRNLADHPSPEQTREQMVEWLREAGAIAFRPPDADPIYGDGFEAGRDKVLRLLASKLETDLKGGGDE